MSLHGSRAPSMKDQLAQDERDLRAELEAVVKEKKRAAKIDLPAEE